MNMSNLPEGWDVVELAIDRARAALALWDSNTSNALYLNRARALAEYTRALLAQLDADRRSEGRVMTRLPRPNPAVYPRMYSRAGRYLHRAISPNSTLAWCSKLKWTSYRAIEGRKPAHYLFLIQFDEHRAAKLQECPECKAKAGRFA